MECCLGQGELMRLNGGKHGLLLQCLEGTVWITTGDGRDYMVRQQTSFEIRSGISAIAEALGPVEIRLKLPAAGVIATAAGMSSFGVVPTT